MTNSKKTLAMAAQFSRNLKQKCAPKEGLEFNSIHELRAAMEKKRRLLWEYARPWAYMTEERLLYRSRSKLMEAIVGDDFLYVRLFPPGKEKDKKPFFTIGFDSNGRLEGAWFNSVPPRPGRFFFPFRCHIFPLLHKDDLLKVAEVVNAAFGSERTAIELPDPTPTEGPALAPSPIEEPLPEPPFTHVFQPSISVPAALVNVVH